MIDTVSTIHGIVDQALTVQNPGEARADPSQARETQHKEIAPWLIPTIPRACRWPACACWTCPACWPDRCARRRWATWARR
ncbi:hypothetical protein CBM2633_B60024 [Cupriavidus taiwanensis]|nr:hypothetical protein CBM2626_B50069 [Cupriavidus taiwanensis]SPA22078.1 hypothetical protein CBM2633_B60024 [Cupriavidus taiwanensis]